LLYTLKIRLYPSPKQANQFLKTMERFNAACNLISKLAFENKIFSKTILQRSYYYQIRDEFKLSSQMVIRAIAKVVESYSDKNKRDNQHKFKPHGAIVYDDRILTVKSIDTVSVLTFVCTSCGHALNADINAALNISRRGAEVIQPNAVA